MLHLLRKKTFIKLITISPLVGGLLLFSFGASAQMGKVELNMYDHDSKPYYFGITVGVNLARFQTDLHPRFLDYDSVFVAEPVNSGGLTLGLSATARLSDRFQLRFNPQLMFIERNIYYKLKHPDLDGLTDVTKKVESVIMSFPFQVKFQSDRIGNFRVYTLAGFKADIDMASNARAKRAEELVKIQKYDFGPEFGIGFNFFFPSFIFSPEIKISNGIRNIHARDENLRFSNVFDKIQSRMIVFSIHLEG
ncbi:MAG TPA: outer membrane beta-barrel protein [Chitinophagaceae bacterium]|nr:outer membrane beta-barrel protein [Chitinophagaceae bacterium]HQV85312.1 outer membrane beta-barrel protein [Chitinophagaceae bacterium]HQX71934.1 outer membrane beta-barrel protein [Chitinophagaceae bacterium]HQZ72879.1 outer membrane beta-barrel protein [Chitinophagaceae bacterium]